MKFSIVTCCWNSQPFFEQCIESTVTQTHDDLEIVFVDGGSTDGTLEMIHSVQGQKTVLNGISGGIAKAMNAGIQAATGDVIAHLHSDDYYLDSGVLQRVASVFERTGCHWLFGRVMSDIDGSLVPESFDVPRYSYRKMLHRNFIPHPATFIRREVFEQCGLFDERLRFAIDYDLWLRIGKVFEPVQLDEHLAVFRRHEGSTTQANQMRSFNEDFQVRMRNATLKDKAEAVLRYAVRRARLHREGVR